MRWVDLDLDNATWTLAAGDTKAKRAHLAPLAPVAVEIIKAMPEVGDYVFSTSANSPIRGFARASRQLDGWLESKGLGLSEPWRFHDLRRTAATHMVRLGVPELVVSRVLNHHRHRAYRFGGFLNRGRRASGMTHSQRGVKRMEPPHSFGSTLPFLDQGLGGNREIT